MSGSIYQVSLRLNTRMGEVCYRKVPLLHDELVVGPRQAVPTRRVADVLSVVVTHLKEHMELAVAVILDDERIGHE